MPLCMLLCKEYLTLVKKNLSLVVFCCNFSTLQQKPHDYISVVAAKIWYLKNVRFLLGHPVYWYFTFAILVFLHQGNILSGPPSLYVGNNARCEHAYYWFFSEVKAGHASSPKVLLWGIGVTSFRDWWSRLL